MTVLFIVPYAPTQVRTRPYHLIRTLARNGHHVTLATLWSNETERRQVANALSGVDMIGVAAPAWRSAWSCARAFLGRDPLQAHFSWQAHFSRALTALVNRRRFDVVHVEHLRGVRYGLALADSRSIGDRERPSIVWDSVDCISDLFRYTAAEGPNRVVRSMASFELRRTERYEPWAAARFRRVLVTSERDREGLLRLADGTQARPSLSDRIVVLPNGVDLDRFSPHAVREASTVVMSGKMSYHANVVGVMWFVDHVLPRIREKRPDVRFVVVGQDPARQIRRLAERPGVTVTGTVRDVVPYLQAASVAVAPIKYAVGIQNKVLEALACGTPVVATRAAVRGLSPQPGGEVMTADEPSAFAGAVVRLLNHPEERERLGQAAREYAEAHHAWSAIGARLEAIYAETAA